MFGYIDGKNFIIVPWRSIVYRFAQVYINLQERQVFSSRDSSDVEMFRILKLQSAMIPPTPSLAATWS